MDYVTTTSLAIMPLLRVLRVLRIIKLIPKAKGLRMMMTTLLWSGPALLNVGAVLLMFMFIYVSGGNAALCACSCFIYVSGGKTFIYDCEAPGEGLLVFILYVSTELYIELCR